MNKIMEMAVGDRTKAVEYQDSESGGVPLSKDQLVKIAPKKGKRKRRLTPDQEAEYQRELQAILLAQQQEAPGKDQESMDRAVQLA